MAGGKVSVLMKVLMEGLAMLSLSIVLLSCQQARYSPEGEFVDLYAELKLASVALSAQDPNKANQVRGVILAQHNMTAAEFHEHFVRLANHPDAWKTFQDRVIRRMDDFKQERRGK